MRVTSLKSVAGHCAAVYRERFGYEPDDLPCSARLDRAGLALPLHSFLGPEDVDRCAAAVGTALNPAERNLPVSC